MADSPSSTQLIRYDAMCTAIAAAAAVDEVKEIRDKAVALEHYARQARNVEAGRKCIEIRIQAERRAGELLRQMEKAKGSPGNQHTGPLDRHELFPISASPTTNPQGGSGWPACLKRYLRQR